MSGVGRAGSRASAGPTGALGALEGPGLFDPRGSLCSLLFDQSMGALEARPLHAGYPCLRTEVISLNKLVDPLDMEILKL